MAKRKSKTFCVFVRTWWMRPGVPGPGKKRYLVRGLETEDAARALAKAYNATHDPGPLSKKAEWDEE